jgi:hypothetical protein
MSKIYLFSGMHMNRFDSFRSPEEVLDIVVDEWCGREREYREKRGIAKVSKLELKNELGRAIGLGNGEDQNAAAKAIYRYCSGETPLSLGKALMICKFIENYELIQWAGYQVGMIMTPRAVINDLEALSNEDIFDEIVGCLKDTTGFVEMLSTTYQSKPCYELIVRIEDVFLKAMLQMEKCRLMLRKLIERMIEPGSQGELWLFGSKKATKKKRK